MKYLIGAAVVVVIALLVWGIWWTVVSDGQRCDRWKQTVISVGQNDPRDLPTVMDMYTDECS